MARRPATTQRPLRIPHSNDPPLRPHLQHFLMTGKTFFDCDRVEFCSTGVPIGDGTEEEQWQPAKVYVSEVTKDSRTSSWLP